MKKRAKSLLCTLLATIFVMGSEVATPSSTDLATQPLVTSATTQVLPNIMYVLDDSGSMALDYLPDWATTPITYLFRNDAYNGIYYNPAVQYTVPVTFDTSGNKTSYPSQTGSATANGASTATKPNWRAVKDDGFSVQSTSTSNLEGNAYFFTFIPGEYCTSEKLSNCTAQSAPSTSYPRAAYLRWCSDPALTTCQANWISGKYEYPRFPGGGLNVATIVVGGSTSFNASVSSIKINGFEIMSGTSSSSRNTATVASGIESMINQCSFAISGSCTVAGYRAVAMGSTVAIYAPTSVTGTYTPVVTPASGSLTYTVTALSGSSSTVPGSMIRTDIVSTNNSYPYPGSTNKASTRTDCAGTTCTYQEEMTNYANWWAYYHTRMQMMKTAASQAFSSLGSSYRVGYMTIDNGSNATTGGDFLNISTFNNTQKAAWYSIFFKAKPSSSTPLRSALSAAGLVYGDAVSSIWGISVTDPVQYACQQNFTILSTDGYWNTRTTEPGCSGRSGAGCKLNTTSAVGQQDGSAPRPYYDGINGYQKSTSQTTMDQTQVSASTSQLLADITQWQTSSLQSQTSQLQTRTSNLQSQTSQLQTQTSSLQSQTSQLQTQTSTLQKSTMYLEKRTSSNSGGSWTSWSSTSSCTWKQTGTSQTQCRYATTNGGSTVWSAGAASWSTASSCTQSFGTNTADNTTWSGNGTSCRYTAWSSWANASSCTVAAQSTGPNYTVGTARNCQYTAWTSWANASTCTPAAQSAGPTNYTVGTATNCQYTAWSGWSGASSCSTVAQDTTSPYTVPTARNCQTVVTSSWSNAASCTTSSTPDSSGYTTQCQYTPWSAWTGTSSCGTVAQDTTSPYTVPTARQCQTAVTSAYANVGSCNANATPDSSGYTTQCQYSAWTNASGACTPTAQSTGPNYTVATACRQTDTGWVGAASCSPGTTGGQTVACNTVTTGPTPVASCSSAVAGSGNNYTQTTCTTSTITPEAGVASCTPVAASSSNGYVATNCHTYTTGPTTEAVCNAEAASAGNNYTATTCASSGGTADTLADVAYYYYNTSLRGGPTTGNCQNDPTWPCNVPSSGSDTANWQHMTTFTLGLGANGYMVFDQNYSNATSGDYYDVAKGSTADGSSVCTWQGTGTICGWPTPSADSQANIDDLWHAAVNGHGSYFSAANPSQLSAGLSNALAGVSARTGAAAAATTSNPNVTSGDNFVFSSTFSTTSNPVVYATSGWTGELERQRINVNTGAILPYDSSQGDWKAQALLDGLVSASGDTRTIYTYNSSASSSGLKPFDWASLDATERGYFNSSNISSLTQFCSSGTYTITGDATTYNCLDSTAQANAAGQNLVDFLRGQYQYEARPTNASQYYRAREHVLGDIVSSESVYVKVPFYDYVDTGYSAYKSAQSTRQGMVYVAANDGMLHAFNSDTGREMWAYVPSMVLPSLYKLADMNYKNNHRFYVDGTPVVGDAYVNGAWTTLLVGGLGAGGAGFYALDVTTPGSPKALWEFKPKTTSCAATAAAAVGQTSDCDLGYSYGNPVITKLADGTWVVLVTSGYNNTSPGDAQGHLFVLDAATGTIINKLSTGVGSNSTTGSCTTAPCPSGLARITAWVDNPSANNTTLRVYGGDLFGYLYRFDVNGADPLANPPTTPARWTDVGAPGYDVLQLAHLVGPNSKSQPITAKPEIGSVNGTAMVYVGTGSYLGASDLVDANQQSPNLQSFYGIKDPLTATGWGDIRSSTIVQQTVTTSGSLRTGTNNPVDLTAKAGWYLDLPDSGERDNTDPALALGTLVFNTNVPNASACTIGGYSWQYALDYRSGAPVIIPVSGDGTAANKLGNALATRPVLVKLPNNTVVSLTKLSDTSTQVMNVPIGSGSMTVRRVNWRELITE